MATKPTANEIRGMLPHFFCSNELHRWSGLFRNMFLTDGAKYVADSCGAYWLMDIIGSYQPRLRANGKWDQTWTLSYLPKGSVNKAKVVCTDRITGERLVSQLIEHTDFPLEEGITLQAYYNTIQTIINLPAER